MVGCLFLRLCKYVAELGKGPWSCTLQGSKRLLTVPVYCRHGARPPRHWGLKHREEPQIQAPAGDPGELTSQKKEPFWKQPRHWSPETALIKSCPKKQNNALVCHEVQMMCFQPPTFVCVYVCVCVHTMLVHLMTEGQDAWNYVL